MGLNTSRNWIYDQDTTKCMVEGDELKKTCVTRYGAFKFMVMGFGLTNAPLTLCTWMNQVFHEYLDQFIVVYLDDIVVYNVMLEERKQT